MVDPTVTKQIVADAEAKIAAAAQNMVPAAQAEVSWLQKYGVDAGILLALVAVAVAVVLFL